MQTNGCQDHCNGTSHLRTPTCQQLNGESATNGSSDCDTRHLSRTDIDIIRLVGQYLKNLGFVRTANELIKESGCILEHPVAALFHEHVMNGEWEKVCIKRF